MHFLHSRRKLLLTSPVHNMHLCAQTERCPCRVHSNIAAAYDRDLLSAHDRCVGVLVKRFHELVPGQILIGREHTIRILTRNPHKFGKSRTRTDKHSLKSLFLDQLVDRDGFADDHIFLYLDSQGLYICDLLCHDIFLRKPELRYAVHQYASRLVERLEDRDIISELRKIPGAGETRRTRTDHCDFPAIFLLCRLRLDAVLSRPVCNETLQLADRDRIPLDPPDTLALALALLRAYTPTYSRER